MAESSSRQITGASPVHTYDDARGRSSNPCCGRLHVEANTARRTERKELYMWTLAAIIGLPVCLALAGAGVLVDSIRPDELRSMGVDSRS